MLSMRSMTMLLCAVLLTLSLFPNAVRSAGEKKKEEAKPNAEKCITRALCYSDEECGQGDGKHKPRCVGAHTGTCNCNACISGVPCTDDKACGGLANACDSKTGHCDCIKGEMD